MTTLVSHFSDYTNRQPSNACVNDYNSKSASCLKRVFNGPIEGCCMSAYLLKSHVPKLCGSSPEEVVHSWPL